MPDGARKKTDDILDKMEKHLYRVYNEAADDISKKWYKYMQSHERTLKDKYNALQEANRSGDKDAIKQAKEDYERAVKNVTLNNDRYNAMLNETTSKISHVNEIALDYVNGNTPKIYTLNYNEFANQDIDGYTFTLVNEQAVKELATKDKTLLPKKKLDIPKDKEWNEKQINSQVLQGILQGENITKIAERLITVTDMNRSSAIRNARTITTAAENKGRQDSFEKAQSDGVIIDREWISTHDERTRAWHAELNGVRVGIDEPWENEYGEIMYPGDPSADPANVYNCRCSIRANVKGFKWDQQDEEEDKVKEKPEEHKETPKSLENYDKTYEEFREKRASQIDDMEPFIEMDNFLNTLIDENEFRMKIPNDDASVLTSILEDGRFKNQFETGTSGGAYDPNIRAKASDNLFGHGNKLSDSEYEKYGYLGSKDITKDNQNIQLGFYGDGIITFKKDEMMDRTTLTVGDSLRDANSGRFIMGTKVTAPDSTVAVGRPGMINDFVNRTKEGIDKYGIDDAAMVGNRVRSYFELQYHGDLTLSDVESITIDKNILDEISKSPDLVKKIKDSDIVCNYIYNGEIISYNFDE